VASPIHASQDGSNSKPNTNFSLPLPTLADAKAQAQRYYELAKIGAARDLLVYESDLWRKILARGLPKRDVAKARRYAEVLIKNLPERAQIQAEFDLLDVARQASNAPAVRSEDYIRGLGQLGYSFRLNECGDSIEVNGQALSDPIRAKIRAEMRDLGFKKMEALEDAYTARAYDNRYHPIKEYLEALEWDGISHIALLASYFKHRHTTKEQSDDVFYLWLRRWLIGCVAKIYTGAQNPMLVLDGPQDVGKSYFAAWLASPLPGYFYQGPINTDDKDCYIRLMSKWLWEVAELGATTRKTDREALKYFLSMETVTIRKPYGRMDTIKPALASFIGTVNNEHGILSDPTGSRRFLVVGLTAIDWDYAKAIDVNQLWAEAYRAYVSGEPCRLTADERQLARAINDEYEVEDPIEDLLRKYFILKPGSVDFLPTTDILDVLESNGLRGTSRRANSMALSTTMRKLGCEKGKQGDIRGYAGIARPEPKAVDGY
jgi:hypothetical protein